MLAFFGFACSLNSSLGNSLMVDPANVRMEGMFLAFLQSQWFNRGAGSALLGALKG